MALQSSGKITLKEIATEFEDTAPHSLKEFYGVASEIPASGTITIKDFYGASNAYSFTMASGDIQEANIRSLAVADGWDEDVPLIVTINSGTTLYSRSTSTGGAIVSGSFPNGVTILNSGAITGMGGSAGQNGGPALQITTSDNVTVTNNSGAFIAGGGGGGAATGGGGGAGQSLPNVAGPAARSVSTTYSSCGSVTFGCSEGGTVTASCCGPSVATITYAAGGNQGAYAGPGGTTTGSSGSCIGSGTGGGPPPCTVSGVTINYGGVIVATGFGGTGGSILSASENVTNSGGGWGAAGTGSGAGAGGAAITGTYATLTNNGTIYGST